MSVYWKDYGGNDESFWEHEWGKQKTLQLFSVLDTYTFLKDAGIVPSYTKTYTYAEIRKALVRDRHVNATIECTGKNSTVLDEVYYYYNVYGSAQDGSYIPAQPGEHLFFFFIQRMMCLEYS
jgi:ribonuclease T2